MERRWKSRSWLGKGTKMCRHITSKDVIEHIIRHKLIIPILFVWWNLTLCIILISDKPDKPIKPQITSEVQARNVTISWQPAYDGYGPIRNYTIQYKSEGKMWTDFVESIPPSSSSYAVTGYVLIWFMVFYATVNNISVISWRSVSLVEETGVLGENHRPVASHWPF